MKKVMGSLVFGFLVLVGVMAISQTNAFAASVEVQDSSFILSNGAQRIADATASDGYTAKMLNTTLSWDIQYRQWDYSNLKPGASYEVYFRVKVKHAHASPTGNAFKMAVYDMTNASFILAEKAVAASSTQDGIWADYKIGTFKPNNGVNLLSFYVSQVSNSGQISEINVDKLIFKEYVPYTIENSNFLLFNGVTNVAESTAQDNSSARLVNGPGANWNIQAPIDGTQIEAGVSYDVSVVVKPERTNWMTSSGDVFGVGGYDTTNATLFIPQKMYNTATDDAVKVRYEFVWGITVATNKQFNPAHDNRVFFYKADNAANFPALRVDKVILTKSVIDDSPVPPISAYPYKITPANADGLNDSTVITYTLASAQTITAKIYNSNHTLVKTLFNGAAQSGTVSVAWDGKNNSSVVVGNDLYTVEVSNGTGILFSKNIQVKTGITLTTPSTNMAKNYFPKGVWYEGAAIPKNTTDAASYSSSTFADIKNAGMNTVMIANFNQENTSVYTTVLDKAQLNGLKLMVHSQIFKTVYNEALNNDEEAMYNALSDLIAPFKNHSALYGYLLYDEPPSDNPRLVDTLHDMKRIIETLDPSHPVIVDLSGVHSAEQYYDTLKTQAFTSDPYAVLAGKAIGDYTNLGYPGVHYENLMDLLTLEVRKDIANEAPFWTILQAFGQEGWYREPTEAELRATTYEAIGHGSKGFTYFMYQADVAWEGMVDANYAHTVKYTRIQTLLSEIEAMKSTILNMRRIGNAATAAGGGGGSGAYANADITTHENPATGDKYLVVVNHDAVNAQNVTITIDRSKLGMDITAIKNEYTNANIVYSTSTNSYTITNLSFAAGEGKILKLVKSTAMVTYTGQDSAFNVFSGATKNNADISASDAKSAIKVLDATNTWSIQWNWDNAQIVPGATYDLYAVVKIKYAHDVTYDSNNYPTFFQPAGNAFSVAAYDGTAGAYLTTPIDVSAASMENMFWHTIKVGSFIPSQTHTQYAYVAPTNNTSNVYAVYVDKFYFVKQ